MPSEAKRPSSPYASSQSPRIPSKAKVWRSLSGSGRQHTTNPQIEKSRENWLRSLRQGSVEPHHHSRDETFKRKTTEEYWISTFRSNGSAETTNTRNSPMRGVHGLGAGTSPANMALTSSSEYLREQLGVSTKTSHHKRSASFGGASQPGTPRYKPQEEMYDEILQLKKTITSQKSECDMMKSKIRRLEEENSRKDKCIDQLIDQITVMSEGGKSKKGPASDNKLVINTLRQQKIKLEHTVQEKDAELQAARERIKNLRSRARQAKASYVQEVMQLQDVLKQYGEDVSLNSHEAEEIPDSARKVKTLRQSVVKLTGENNRLQDENRSLKRDLDRALDGSEESDDDEERDEKIKYSALSRSELVAVVKKMKKKEASKVQENREQNREEQLRLKKVIQNLKEDISQLRNEKNHQTLEIERLQENNEKLKEDKMDLLQHAQQHQQQTRTSESRRRRRDSARKQVESLEVEKKQTQIRQRVAAKSIQRQWRKHKQEKDEATDEAINVIQSSFRGHVVRQEMLQENRSSRQKGRISKSHSQSTLVATEEESSDIEEDISYNEDYVSNDDDASVDVIQAAMRGHVARSEVLKSPHSSRPSTAGVRSNYSSHLDDDY